MLTINIPGFKILALKHLVLDFNGTLACNGEVLPGVAERMVALAGRLAIHVVTGNTFDNAAQALAGLPCQVELLSGTGLSEAKQAYVVRLGADKVAAVGNGRNDRLMLAVAALGIAVVQGEGAAAETLASADVVAPGIAEALDLLLVPKRLVATLRS